MMSDFGNSLKTITGFLKDNGIKYMVVGGLANNIWGLERATLDIDITIWVEDKEAKAIIDLLINEFQTNIKEPYSFVKKNSVLPVLTDEGITVDMIFGRLPFEKRAIKRAKNIEIEGEN